MDDIVALCRRRGFIFQSSEIYGGINGFWDYGPLGAALKRNLKNAWWHDIINCPPDGADGQPLSIVPLDSTIIMHPKVWEASGHVAGFNDPMVDCTESKKRYRADHLVVLTNASTSDGRCYAFLEGDEKALTAQEVEGLKLFTNLGCMVCHTGEFLGGSMYEKVGAVEPWPNQEDQGRFEVTKRKGDRMMFKVPSLRNIEHTGPYFHDGIATGLPQAVRMMGKHQLGLDLDDAEVESIVAWLKSLTGNLPEKYVAQPELPASTAKTPAADKS